jgi:hypothetical protein
MLRWARWSFGAEEGSEVGSRGIDRLGVDGGYQTAVLVAGRLLYICISSRQRVSVNSVLLSRLQTSAACWMGCDVSMWSTVCIGRLHEASASASC